MTNYQNRRRWAIKQQDKARAIWAERQHEILAQVRQNAIIREWCNMYFGSTYSQYLPR